MCITTCNTYMPQHVFDCRMINSFVNISVIKVDLTMLHSHPIKECFIFLTIITPLDF